MLARRLSPRKVSSFLSAAYAELLVQAKSDVPYAPCDATPVGIRNASRKPNDQGTRTFHARGYSSEVQQDANCAGILDGRLVSSQWLDEMAHQVKTLGRKGGRPPGLGVILVGDRLDSHVYVLRKQEACERVGIFSTVRHLPSDVTQVGIRQAVKAMCADSRIDGVLVQLPLPKHIDEEDVIEHFDPGKDVDGFHPLNVGRTLMRGRTARFVPCTALGCIELLRRSSVQIQGKNVVIVGDSNIVGMPLAMLFRDQGSSSVTVVHRSSYSGIFLRNRTHATYTGVSLYQIDRSLFCCHMTKTPTL